MIKGKHIVVWFSCGAASAVAAKLTIEKYAKDNLVSVVNHPIKEEDPDNLRFLRDVRDWLGWPIIEWKNPKFPDASCVTVWDKRKAMSFPTGAPCTTELKKEARRSFETVFPVDWHVLGFTADERGRFDRFVMNERDNVLPVLIDAELDKQACMDMITISGLSLPAIYKKGFPNANCVGCVKATSPTYWNLVRKQYPDVFEERAKQSRRIGARLVRVKGERLFLDELNPGAKGRPLKTMQIDCGIFCEEPER